jgi:crotonobetainyl-CoA:carnitine CoA-transferase CaiB-like acyl-CoA transferase
MEGAESAMRPIPAVGEHSATILAELGFDEATISRWKAGQIF